jgi:pSer/pThr/pTyr-binding forkhead associated (FHA) protein
MVGPARVIVSVKLALGLSQQASTRDWPALNRRRNETVAMDIKLVMFREDGSKRVFPLGVGTTSIGRGTNCNIRIPLAVVSRGHAEISVDEDGALLRDLGAANGTYLNDQRLQGEEDLEPGDRIMIGPVVFTVQIDGSPDDDELVEVRTNVGAGRGSGQGKARVATSKHVVASDEDVDPISALEELASSADQTAINPEDD